MARCLGDYKMAEITSREYAAGKDEEDKLSTYKKEFYLPDYLYYEANGLGPMSRRSEETLMRVSYRISSMNGAWTWLCGAITNT